MQKLNYLLKQVQSPGQYVDSEKNSAKNLIQSKYSKTDIVKICLSFPDKYSIGMSNLGIEILYKLLNSQEDILCERVFAPDTDFEKLLISENIELFSLETNNSLKNFDIIGFSLQSELCYSNIFTILSLAKINFKSFQRKTFFPIIIAGGISSNNPHVLSDYIDFFVLGEAEKSILEIVAITKKYKKILNKYDELTLKTNFLKEINGLKETFVPSIDATKKVFPSVINLNNSFYPLHPTVPNIRTTHMRLNVEISRGCAYNCNFCQAGYVSKPLRIRPMEFVEKIVDEGIKSTGYNEISFTGFCVTNYPKLNTIIKNTRLKYKNKNVSITLPSLRINDITEELADLLVYPHITSITLAPETGNEKLRETINKPISDQEIYEKILVLYKFGFKKIKFYFMIGLPNETMEDIDSICKMIKKLRQLFPKINFAITISPFVPKPHTPFQFSNMNTIQELEQKMFYLKKNIFVDIRKNNIYSSIIEALISRGNKKIGNLIENCWYDGARFDNWDENFNYEIWYKNILKLNINVEDFIFKSKTVDDNFPWDNVVYLNNKNNLYSKYLKSIEKKTNTNFYLKNNFWNQDLKKPDFTPVSKNKSISLQEQFYKKPILRYRIKFSKFGNAIFFSHLDQIEILQRALRLSEVNFVYTNGYKPEIKLYLGIPTPVGYNSESEFIDVETYQKISIDKKKLTELLPSGYEIIDIFEINSNTIKLNEVNLIEYKIKSNTVFNIDKLNLFLKQKETYFVEKDGKTKIFLTEIIEKIILKNDFTITIFQNIIPKKSLKPELVLQKIFDLEKNYLPKFEITRKNLYIKKANYIIKL